MSLKNMKLEELELLSCTDLTYIVLKEEKKSLNTPTVFHRICDLLGYSETDFEEKIGDYYTSLTIDKRFVMLDNAEWDLRERHVVDINLEEETTDDEEELEDEEIEESEEEEIDADEESIESTIEDDLDDTDDDMDDLSVIDEEDLEEAE